MLTSRGLKSPCALLLLPPQPPFSHATVFRREAQADAVGSGNSELCAVFQAFAHAVPSTCNAIPVFTTCLVLKHPSWLKSHHLFFEGLPYPRRHDCTSFVHHRGILQRSLLWGLRGFFFCMFAPLPTSIHLLTAWTVPPRKLSKTIKTRPVTY